MKKLKYALAAGLATFALIATGCKPEAVENNENSNQTEENQTTGDDSSQSGESESTGSDETTWSNDLILVPGGTIIGADYTNNYTGVFPKGRTVTLSDFYMSKYEITQAEYKEVMQGQKISIGSDEYTLEAEPSNCTTKSTTYALDIASLGEKHERRPVEGVTWFDAVNYCNVRSQHESLTPAYKISVTKVKKNHITVADVSLVKNANGYRLPTEAEWEYAARGGDPEADDWNYILSGVGSDKQSYNSSSYVIVDSALDTVGWYGYNNKTGKSTTSSQSDSAEGKGSHEVGKKTQNRLGLYDMSGNVSEWCYDKYIKTMNSETVTDPAVCPWTGTNRVIRGGYWGGSAYATSVSYRSYRDPSEYGSFLGFRVVRSAQ